MGLVNRVQFPTFYIHNNKNFLKVIWKKGNLIKKEQKFCWSFFCTISIAFLHFFVTKNSAEILRKNAQQNFCCFFLLGKAH